MQPLPQDIATQIAILAQVAGDFPRVIGTNIDTIGEFQAQSWIHNILMSKKYFSAPGVNTYVDKARYIDTGGAITVIKERHTKATGRKDKITSDKIQRLNPMGIKSSVDIPVTRYTSDSVPLLWEDWSQYQAFPTLADGKILWDNKRKQISIQNQGLGVRLKDSDILEAISGNTIYYEKTYDGKTPVLVPREFGFDKVIFPTGLIPMNIGSIQSASFKFYTARIAGYNEPLIGFTSGEIFTELNSQYKYGLPGTASIVQYNGPNAQNPYFTIPEHLKFGNFELYPVPEDLKKWTIDKATGNLGIALVGKRAFAEYFPMRPSIRDNKENGIGVRNTFKQGGLSPEGFYHIEETVLTQGVTFLDRLQYYCAATWGYVPGEYNNAGLILLNPKGTYHDFTDELKAIQQSAEDAFNNSIGDNIIPVDDDIPVGNKTIAIKDLEIKF